MSGVSDSPVDPSKRFYLPDVEEGKVTFNNFIERNAPSKATATKIEKIFSEESGKVEATINAVTECRRKLGKTNVIEEEKLLEFVKKLKEKIKTKLENSSFKSIKWSEKFGGLSKLTKLVQELSDDIADAK